MATKLLYLTIAGSGTFPSFVSVDLIDVTAMGILVLVLLGILWKYSSLRKTLPPRFLRFALRSLGLWQLVRAFGSELVNRVLLQRDVINRDRVRRLTHLCMFWGFIGLSLTTTLDYLYNREGNYIPLYGGMLSPIRWLGNISGVVMVIGAAIAIFRLVVIPRFRRGRTFSDVWFSSLLLIAGVTGFIAEYFGELAYEASPGVPPVTGMGVSFSASPLIIFPYGIHLVAVTLLLTSAPFSAFIHALNVPSMRYLGKLGELVSVKNNTTGLEQQRKFKEQAMIDQIHSVYDRKSKDPSEGE